MHCNWIDEQPYFIKTVEYNGEKLAKLHALTKKDYALVSQNSNDYKDPISASLWMIYAALTGHGCGWELDRDVSIDNIAKLPDDIYTLLINTITKNENKNDNEEIEKN